MKQLQTELRYIVPLLQNRLENIESLTLYDLESAAQQVKRLHDILKQEVIMKKLEENR